MDVARSGVGKLCGADGNCSSGKSGGPKFAHSCSNPILAARHSPERKQQADTSVNALKSGSNHLLVRHSLISTAQQKAF